MQHITLLNKEFTRLSDFIYKECGIKMPPVKKILLESRLQKRLKTLHLETFREYCDYLISPEGKNNELPAFIDRITTNKTDFFRNPAHFDFFSKTILPEYINNGGGSSFNVWSAGCSTGEEPYSVAIALEEFKRIRQLGSFDFSILATDISKEVLLKAKRAVYTEEQVAVIPLALKKKYLLKSKDKQRQLVKIIPELRSCIRYGFVNLVSSDYEVKTMFDVIFCRNVLIYFDKKTQDMILNNLIKYLKPGGYLFLGHSESLLETSLVLDSVAPTVYRK